MCAILFITSPLRLSEAKQSIAGRDHLVQILLAAFATNFVFFQPSEPETFSTGKKFPVTQDKRFC